MPLPGVVPAQADPSPEVAALVELVAPASVDCVALPLADWSPVVVVAVWPDVWSPVVAVELVLADWSPVVVALSIVTLDRPLRGESGLSPTPLKLLWERSMTWDEPLG